MNESIFGSTAPKFVFDLGGSNEKTVILDYWVPITDEPDDDRDILQESELEADRDILNRGNFWTFEGRVNLYKYKIPNLIRSKFEEIYQYNKKKVVLWKHRDGIQFKDKDGNNILWYVNVTPKNLYTLDYRDILFIKFRSLKEVNYSDNSTIIIQPSEIQIVMTDFIIA